MSQMSSDTFYTHSFKQEMNHKKQITNAWLTSNRPKQMCSCLNESVIHLKKKKRQSKAYRASGLIIASL